MKTSVIEVHDMLTVLSVDEVEKRIGEVPGVSSVTVNFAVGNATTRYDETRLEVADIKSAARQQAYESAAPAAASAGDSHKGHTASGMSPAVPAPATPVPIPVAVAAGQPIKAVPSTAPKASGAAPVASDADPSADEQQVKTGSDKG
jgi:copper chaperone CopZ